MKIDEHSELVCVNSDDGQLVFEPRNTLSESERERADLHFGSCPACQDNMEFEHLMNRMGENDSCW